MSLSISHVNGRNGRKVFAADIGATKANLGLFEWNDGQLHVGKQHTYKTKDFAGAIELIRSFQDGEVLPPSVCLAVAGPVQENKALLTNIQWKIDGKEISEALNNIPVMLINDLEASAYGLSALDKKDIYLLLEGKKQASGNIAVIAPGTGLGEAGLYNNCESYYPFATEGGHVDFAPRTELDSELYHFLKRKFDHVSWERLVSGPGICNIYDFLFFEKERDEPAWLKEKLLLHDKAKTITDNATECAICKETIDIFFRYLAQESGNLVLKLKATGGLFIGGGILPHVLPLLHKEYFQKWFTNFGRLKSLLQNVPVKIILNEKTPLLGAAYYGIHAC